MAIYKRETMEYLLGVSTLTPDWYLGLSGLDPYVDLSLAEASGSRVFMQGAFSWSGTAMTNTADVYTGEVLATCDCDGWFMVNGLSTDILWAGVFTAPVNVLMGASLYFPAGSISLEMSI
jgi:hypothetical protein